MENLDPQVWIQGGAVGIAILLIIFLYKIVSNHISHNTEILTELKGLIKANIKSTDRNSRIMERVERVMDKNGHK